MTWGSVRSISVCHFAIELLKRRRKKTNMKLFRTVNLTLSQPLKTPSIHSPLLTFWFSLWFSWLTLDSFATVSWLAAPLSSSTVFSKVWLSFSSFNRRLEVSSFTSSPRDFWGTELMDSKKMWIIYNFFYKYIYKTVFRILVFQIHCSRVKPCTS